MSGDEFDWWFDGNPAGSLRSVAVLDGRVVGVAGHSLYVTVLDGERRTASFSVHAVTDPSARGRGIFVELERKHEREATEMGVSCVLAFASAPTAPLFLGPARLDGDREAPGLGAAGMSEGRPVQPCRRSTWTAMRRPTGRTTSSATRSTCAGATSNSPRGYEVVAGDRRIRRRLAGQAAQGQDDRRARRPRRLEGSAAPGSSQGEGTAAFRAAGARASGRHISRRASCRRRRR